MKMKKLTYLFAICPAVVALASCNKTSTMANAGIPGKEMPYAEAYEYVKTNFAYEKGYLEKLSKLADVTVSTAGIDIDGTFTIPEFLANRLGISSVAPTHVKFNLPRQENITFNLNNEDGASGAVATTIAMNRIIGGDVKQTTTASYTPVTSNVSPAVQKPIARLLPSLLTFNPFISTDTLAAIDSLVGIVKDLNIINQKYSLDGDIFYFSIGIGDLGKFTEFLDSYAPESNASVGGILRLIRGKDGSFFINLGFDKTGFLTHANIDLNSNLMSVNYPQGGMSKDNLYSLYYGKMNFSVDFALKHTFYAENETFNVSFTDASHKESVKFRKPTFEDLMLAMNYSSTEYFDPALHRPTLSTLLYLNNGDPKVMKAQKDAFKVMAGYYDYLTPGYGTDFVVTPIYGQEIYYDDVTVKINGFEYPLSTFNPNYSDNLAEPMQSTPLSIRRTKTKTSLEITPYQTKDGTTSYYVSAYPEFYEAVHTDVEVIVYSGSNK